ncbi:hypothetical protein PVAP13_5NG421440 [Panicum virgatum]|uniref:Uncharacterized protein n=1 Tax=Panicum virgatum TaxID=38727 RepID=A0A8T0RVR9_PANVG|nr:hypothetical protein PVAP13_5NG421440 [Panicum virgatum]
MPFPFEGRKGDAAPTPEEFRYYGEEEASTCKSNREPSANSENFRSRKKQQRRNKSSRLRTHEPGLWRLHSSNPVTAVRDHARERRGNRSRRRNNGTSGSLRFPCASWKPKFSGKERSFFSGGDIAPRGRGPTRQAKRSVDANNPDDLASTGPQPPPREEQTKLPPTGKANREPLSLTFHRCCCWWWWWCSVACIAPRPPRPQRSSAARETTRICPAAPPHARPSRPPGGRARGRGSERDGRQISISPPLPSRSGSNPARRDATRRSPPPPPPPPPPPQPERSPRSVARASLATEQLAARVEGRERERVVVACLVVWCGVARRWISLSLLEGMMPQRSRWGEVALRREGGGVKNTHAREPLPSCRASCDASDPPVGFAERDSVTAPASPTAPAPPVCLPPPQPSPPSTHFYSSRAGDGPGSSAARRFRAAGPVGGRGPPSRAEWRLAAGVGEPVASFLGFPCGILSRLPQASALDACAGARFLVGAAARPGSPVPAEPDAPFQSRPRLPFGLSLTWGCARNSILFPDLRSG